MNEAICLKNLKSLNFQGGREVNSSLCEAPDSAKLRSTSDPNHDLRQPASTSAGTSDHSWLQRMRLTTCLQTSCRSCSVGSRAAPAYRSGDGVHDDALTGRSRRRMSTGVVSERA